MVITEKQCEDVEIISAEEVIRRNFVLIDVRERLEFSMQSLTDTEYSVIESERHDWCRLALSYTHDKATEAAITVCRSGGRSLKAAALIHAASRAKVYSCSDGATDIFQLLAEK